MTDPNSILHSVLMDKDLMELGGYKSSETENLYDALKSDNFIVAAVAKLIYSHEEGKSDTAIYREINNFLQDFVFVALLK